MAVEFTRSDLLTDISEKELSSITTKLVIDGDPDPVTAAIGRAQATVVRYTERYRLPEEQEKGYVRDLALYFCQPRLQEIPPKRQKAYDQTMRELRDIRDGKFPDLPQQDPLPDDVQPYEGKFGSDPKLCIR